MWKSKHIFIGDYKLIEVFLQNYLLKYIENNSPDEWFFIRYWQGGPHIRLRYNIQDINQKAKFENGLIALLSEFKEEYSNYEFEEFKYDKRVIELEKVSKLEVYDNFSIEDIEYKPEIARYGGIEAMKYSEKLFNESSKLASYIIQNVEWRKRYIVALDLMYYSCDIVKRLGLINSEIEFFQSYNSVWKQFESVEPMDVYVQALSNRLKDLKNRKEPFESYLTYLDKLELILRDIVKEQNTFSKDTVYYIMISHIHMLNNRLGLSPQNEHLLSQVFLINKGDRASDTVNLEAV
ncbi:lantibiotic dehydratase C-terminal domain-containing protein [Hathewaya massiliensis]|uniref:lantibiotic dehydratase C-terminal domain-containing protein n=1 Tax=Hathewaya massiliensis TaxID=1964382 RepID=UPI001158479C|nr:lantibiotic dehydratase C-terminal domain-containing protein [Hathewaya massiliensis]